MSKKKNEEQDSPQPFYHASGNFISAYFGKIPEHLQPQLSAKKNENELMANLISLLTDPGNSEFREETLALLRANDARSLLVAMIGKKEYAKYRKELLTACWETGLDFAPYLENIIAVLSAKDCDEPTIIEVYTVTGEMKKGFEKDKLAAAIRIVNELAAHAEKTRKELLTEIARLLINFQ